MTGSALRAPVGLGVRRHCVAGLILAALVSNSLCVSAQEVPGSARVIEDLRIDPERADLSEIHGLAVSATGLIAVGQPQDLQVRIFSREGRDLGRFGRAGDGPGEYRWVGPLMWHGDSLGVVDLDAHRLTLLGLKGQVLATRRTPVTLQSPHTTPIAAPLLEAGFVAAWLPSNEFVIVTTVRGSVQPAPWTRLLATNRSVLVLVSPAHEFERLLLAMPTPEALCARDVRGTRVIMPLCAFPRFGISPDGSRIALAAVQIPGVSSSQFRLIAVTTAGDTIIDKDYAFERQAVPPSVIDSIRTVAKSSARTPEGRARASELPIPQFFPPLFRVVVADDGTVLVGMNATGVSRTWRRYDAHGHEMDRLTLPRSVEIQVIRGQFLWGTDTNADGLEAIVRYKILSGRGD